MLDALRAIGILWLTPIYAVWYALSAMALPESWNAVKNTWTSPILAYLSYKFFHWLLFSYAKENPASFWAVKRFWVRSLIVACLSAWISIFLSMPGSTYEGGDGYTTAGEEVETGFKTPEEKKRDAGKAMICIFLPAVAVLIKTKRRPPAQNLSA